MGIASIKCSLFQIHHYKLARQSIDNNCFAGFQIVSIELRIVETEPLVHGFGTDFKMQMKLIRLQFLSTGSNMTIPIS